MTKNHFTTLGLKVGATETDIKKAYRSLAKQWHPDKNNADGAEEKFKEISAAYEHLKSQDRREIHERDLNRPRPTARPEPSGTYKSEFRSTSDADAGTSWSRKFGQHSENTYSSSTFGHFADEGREKQDTKAGRRRKKMPKQKSAPTRSKPWSRNWNDMDDEDQYYDIPPTPSTRPKSNFSYAFQSFVDDLGTSFNAFFGGPYEFSSFFDGSDPFADFYQQGTFSTLSAEGVPRPRPRKRNVANEQGPNGLNREYQFTPRTFRSQTSFSNKDNYYMFTDNDTTQYASDDDDMDSRLFKCTYCEKRMPFSQLSTHEPGCALRRGGKFEDSDEDDQEPKFDFGHYSASPEEDQYPQTTGDWRQTHEDLLRNIRLAKKAAKCKPREGSATTRNTTTTNFEEDSSVSQVECKWCGRSFSHPAAKQHIPFCEKWTKEHGTPLNPAGKAATRDQGSKSHRAREYAKHVPKPREKSQDEYDSDSPRSSRTHYDNFPSMGARRETYKKQTASSGTGLHASYSTRADTSDKVPPKGGASEVGGVHTTSRSYAARNKANSTKFTPRANVSGKYASSKDDRPSSSGYSSSRISDGYGFGLSGSKIKTETRPPRAGDTCTVCKKKFGAHGRILCMCGVRKTGA